MTQNKVERFLRDDSPGLTLNEYRESPNNANFVANLSQNIQRSTSSTFISVQKKYILTFHHYNKDCNDSSSIIKIGCLQGFLHGDSQA